MNRFRSVPYYGRCSRLGKPEELGRVICFLCSDGAGVITGHVLPHADGWA